MREKYTKILITAVLLVLFISPSFAAGKRIHHEEVYQKQFCSDIQGSTEHILPDRTRIDCLADEYAIEVDFAEKWAECVGAAIHYAEMTCLPDSGIKCRKPACALILEKETDEKYTKRIHNMKLFTITPEQICVEEPVISDDTVILNVKTGTYHKPTCSAAKRCTVNCREASYNEVKNNPDYKPCKKCH